MANICDFELKVCGSKADRNRFFKKLNEMAGELTIEGSEEQADIIAGTCKWSVKSSLIDSGFFQNNAKNLLIEVWAEEPGFEFEEHYIFENQMELLSECADTTWWYWDHADYPDYADYKKDYPDAPGPDQFNEDGDCVVGGFENYREYSI